MVDADTTTDSSKRRKSGKRTARACDECKLRKSKCDGLQPCEACQSTDRYCTFNLSASRSTGSGTRIRILEDRLRRARAYLNEAQKRTPSLANVDFDALLGPTEDFAKQGHDSPMQNAGATNDNDDDDPNDPDRLESMMDSYGQLNVDSHGGMDRDFYGAASGLAWIQKAGHYIEDSAPSSSDAQDAAAIQLFDAPLPPKQDLGFDGTGPPFLPPRDTATTLLHVVFTQVYPMFHFLCELDFQVSTDRIYSRPQEAYQETDQAFLPLFYLVMALGYLFSTAEHERHGCRVTIAKAMRYFIAARGMLDIAHLRTIVSLQSLIALMLYLVSTARMASAHAFLGAACSAAMRQGLHFRSTHEADFPVREKKVRRRVFWAVMNLDMYITSILGLPPFMDISAVDPAVDCTIESALKEARTANDLSSSDAVALAASARFIELMRVVFKAQRTLFPKPTDPPDAVSRNGTISVSAQKLEMVEKQFRDWARSLTEILSHPDNSIETQCVKYEVQVCYYFAQIVLYRAFLHYLVKRHEDKPVSQRQLSYAQTCVRMAKKVVELSIEHQRRGLLCPASWQSVYTVFISIVCLVFAYATRKEGTTDTETHKDIENGIRLLACTACTTDTGSVRCLEILRRLIKRVSYAVDVDLDRICAGTQPCCTNCFIPETGSDVTPAIHELQIPGENPRNASVSTSMLFMASGGHQWSLSPDATMTKPSFSEITHHAHNLNQQSETEEMMEIPLGGLFDWQDNKSDRVNQHVADASTMPHLDNRPTPSTSRRLTADDITAFMNSNPVDESFNHNRG